MLLNFKLFSRVYYAMIFLALILLIGIVGFMLVEDMTFFDAFYMTIITVSTVGFGEDLTQAGKLFACLLIITSFGTFAYAVTAITSYLAGGEYKKYFNNYKVLKEMDKLVGHVIVCGYGRVGKQAVRQLKAYGKVFVVIEQDPERVERLDELNYIHLNGDATDDETLLKAGLNRAQAIITTLPKDADNLFVVLSARELSPTITIISRASQPSSTKKLRIAGATNVIMPDSVGGTHMASLVVTPDVMEFLDHISVQGSAAINLEEISFSELPEDFRHKTIGELNAAQITGCNIIGFKTAQGEYVINPSAGTEVIPNSKLFVLGNPDQIKRLNQLLGVTHQAL